MDEKYFSLLSKEFNSEEKIVTEIINLEAILNLPKGTEHFLSDLHGEYDAFYHVISNGSGNVKQKIKSLFYGRLDEEEMRELAVLIYYPDEKLALIKRERKNTEKWYDKTISRLNELCLFCSSKYTRSKLRKALPPRFSYIIEELLYKTDEELDKKEYYHEIIEKMVSLGQADNLIIDLTKTIKRLVVDHLHIVGDVYDRGPAPDKIMDLLINHHSVDIQWGNHDILWMGAFCGSAVCLMGLIRICARYDNLDIIEDSYGINLRPLLIFAEKYYGDNKAFRPKKSPEREKISKEEELQICKIHQAAAILQFKLENGVAKRNPDFKMEHRLLFNYLNFEEDTLTHDGSEHKLSDTCFENIDRAKPYTITGEESELIEKLLLSIWESPKLRKHMQFLFSKGSLYLKYNNNLLIHGCVPMDENGEFSAVSFDGKTYAGPALFDYFEAEVMKAYEQKKAGKPSYSDIFWYLWSGEKSPLFGKKKMTTFERYFSPDKKLQFEELDQYYTLRKDEKICKKILKGFGLEENTAHIINGHTPVKEINGEEPIKASGKLIVIDGGFSKAYHRKTGFAGYTLLYNSYGMQLVSHQPFDSKESAVKNGTDIISSKRLVEREGERKKVLQTDIGKKLAIQAKDLKILLKKTT